MRAGEFVLEVEKDHAMTTTFRCLIAAVISVTLLGSSAVAQDSNLELRDKAIALNRVTGDEAIMAKLRELYKDKAGLKKLIAEARSLAKEKEKELPLNYTANYILARAAGATKDYDSGEFFYKASLERAFKLHSLHKKAQVLDGLSTMFVQAKKFDDAYFTCQKYLDLKSENDAQDQEIEFRKILVSERMIRILCRKKEFDKALDLSELMLRATGDSWLFMQSKAEVLRESGKFEAALAAYNDTIDKIEANERMKDEEKKEYVDRCKYVLSSVYSDLKQLDKSIETLEALVASQPDNASYQNDLGYLLADNGRRLDDAQKMIEKALELDKADRKKMLDEGLISPDEDVANSAYLDSLAWVHFKKKNYDKALELMLQVVKHDEAQHVEIYDHLAQVQLAKGQKAEAIKSWEKALTMENVTIRDDERKAAVKKKLEENK